MWTVSITKGKALYRSTLACLVQISSDINMSFPNSGWSPATLLANAIPTGNLKSRSPSVATASYYFIALFLDASGETDLCRIYTAHCRDFQTEPMLPGLGAIELMVRLRTFVSSGLPS